MEKHIWAPWRMEYIIGKKAKECIFCLDEDRAHDKEKLVLYRSSLSFVIMNRYPYNNGHLMVAPFKHLPTLEEMDGETAQDMFMMLKKSMSVLRVCLKAEGFNVGINTGRAGGAGVEDHLHVHIVPRWNGDINFMPVLGDVRVIPEHLEATYNKIFPHFNAPQND
jgi:ATP adenylyltransferase